MSPILPLVAIAVAFWIPGTSYFTSEDKPLPSGKKPVLLMIAQQYGGEDPHGKDPHGDDPHDEQHDAGLPANKEQKARRAPKDVYGGDQNNQQSPYPPDLR